MSELRYSTIEIIESLEKNRDEFKKNYEIAIAEYNQAKRRKVFKAVDDLNLNIDPVVYENFGLKKPIDMTEKYDMIISRYKRCQDETVSLTEFQFEQIFFDKWDWVMGAKALNSTYTNMR